MISGFRMRTRQVGGKTFGKLAHLRSAIWRSRYARDKRNGDNDDQSNGKRTFVAPRLLEGCVIGFMRVFSVSRMFCAVRIFLAECVILVEFRVN
jgi:hypothetical protein